ncbi:MAG: bifunctional pyr operon transcriptional regulator/uracil phosphoribosyltransferase PyrR [Planctomycetota bacterium]
MQALADASQLAQLISEMGAWVDSKRQANPQRSFALVGIRSRGDVVAHRVAEQLDIAQVGVLDITLYRDDLSEIASQPTVRTTEIEFSLDGLDVVLIDDVLMSGRSIRAALSSLMDMGRPRRVWLAVLVDRGAEVRELPIAADYVGLTHAGDEHVRVLVTPTDEQDAILLGEDA